MAATRALRTLVLLPATLLAAACARATTSAAPAAAAPTARAAAACTFTNPLGVGADPWVLRENGQYYMSESTGREIWIYRSASLTHLKQNGVRVWAAPDTGWNRGNVWAPELHHLGGRWYVYYAAGRSGPPYVAQRAGVLESAGDDPQGAFADRGQLYTGDSISTHAGNRWAIDMTVQEIGGQLYALWSGWAHDAATDKTPQQLYAARMSSPTEIATNRVLITAPTASWERGTKLDLEEGPEFLTHADRTFVIYSTRESWLPDYRLGMLTLTPGADPLDPASYVKSAGPVFTRTATTLGPGHASFTTSPDGTESWIVYHVKRSEKPGWDRRIQAQRFTWNEDGTPNFGSPIAAGVPLAVPAAECGR
jgi:GH43 family beta-xylosidase